MKATQEQFNALAQGDFKVTHEEDYPELTCLKPSYQVSQESLTRKQRRAWQRRQQRADNICKVVLCVIAMLVGIVLGAGL